MKLFILTVLDRTAPTSLLPPQIQPLMNYRPPSPTPSDQLAYPPGHQGPPTKKKSPQIIKRLKPKKCGWV
jgi:hypothetical protein